MKGMILVPPAIALMAALGLIFCRMAGWAFHWHELALAAIISFLAAEFAFVPAMLVRGAEPATVSQAALGGTMLQMATIVALAALATVLKLVGEPTAFAWWMLVFYWSSLAVVVAGQIALIRGKTPDRRESGGPDDSGRPPASRA